MKKQAVIILSICLLAAGATAQQKRMRLRVLPADKDTAFFRKPLNYRSNITNNVDGRQVLQSLLLKLYDEGYLAASFDSLVQDSLVLRAYCKVGDRYRWAHLRKGNVDEGLLSRSGFREKLYRNKPFHFKRVAKLQQRLLRHAIDNGYPFASVYLDSMEIDSHMVRASLHLEKRQQIIIDSIIVHGEVKIAQRYLHNYLGITPGSLYNASLIEKIGKRIKELAFLQQDKPSRIAFYKDKAKVHLYLKPKKASRFNFLLGVLPNSEKTGKLLLTGEAQLSLMNSFGVGELLSVDWRKLEATTSRLKARVNYPYLPLLPFGAELDFELYKKDSMYLDRTLGAGFQYLFVGGNHIKAFVRNRRSSLLSVDTLNILLTGELPENIDVSYTLYGLEYLLEKLDYRLNPRRGFALKLMAGAGSKVIQQNNKITSVKGLEGIYDTVQLRMIQYKLDYVFDKYWHIGGRSTIKTGLAGGALIGDKLFENELYRIGGNQILRGFDEESILASWYNILTLEYRYLLGENSYFYLFGDGAYVENSTRETNNSDMPFGFGVGMTFETKAGIFALSYALGRQFDNPISFRSAKIHFGYVNYF